MAQIEYNTRITIDAFGTVPGGKPGEVVELMYAGRVFRVTLGGNVSRNAAGYVFCDAHVAVVDGPVTRDALPFEERHPHWRKYTKPRKCTAH